VSRRRFLVAAGALLVLAARGWAEPSARVPLVGVLLTHVPVDDTIVVLLRDGLRSYGYEDGRNVRLELRSAMGQLDRLPELTNQLVTLPVDALVVVNDVSLRAAMRATHTIPIVTNGWAVDPVAAGTVESYRRPGSNVTGIFTRLPSLWGKRLEMIKELLPGASPVAVLYDSFGRPQLPEVEQSARALGIRLEPIEFRGPEEIDGALQSAVAAKAKAVLLTFSPVLWEERARVAALALRARMPTVSMFDPFAREGCLLSYGPSVSHAIKRLAYLVSRILQGTKPTDLPVEQVTTPTLVVNLKTAKALGIRVPDSVRLLADELIR
jgi:putative ABC transport system substrate-binding protein